MSSASPRPRPRASAGNEKLIESFRGDPRAPIPLHALERGLVAVAALHLVFIAWALGGRAPWAQVVSLGIGLLALLLALVTRRYTGELAPQGQFRLVMWPRLVRFPVFWLGLVLFAYVLVQALNPSWTRVSAPPVWYIQSQEHVAWLPNGVDAPFERMNAWRMLCFWGGAWALGCALWTGVTRRAAVIALVNVLIVSAVVMAIVAIAGKISGATKIFWFIPAPAHYFHGAFVYKNHAGAYLNLMCGLTLATACWHYIRGIRRLERSTPAPVYLFCAIIIGVAVFMSRSRAAMLLFAIMVLLGLVLHFIWRGRVSEGNTTSRWVGALMGFGAVAFVALAAYFLNLDSSIEQIRNVWEAGREAAIESRIHARDATLDMAEDKLALGWGAGSFRHVFPNFQQHYPEIWSVGRHVMFWDHAHNDYVQVLAELGVVGLLPVALALGWALVRLARLGVAGNPAFLLLLLGLCTTMAHAWVDMPLYNAGIFTTFAALWVVLLRWAEFDQGRG